MNRTVAEILRESREKRKRTIKIIRRNIHTSDVEMKDVSMNHRNGTTMRGNRRRNRRSENNDEDRENKFKGRRFDRNERRNISRRNSNSVNNYRRLYITNLNLDITNSELKTLFESIGPLKRCGIHWNEIGQSKGTADVEFFNPKHAEEAKERYNSGILKGVPIRINWARSRGVNRSKRMINETNHIDQQFRSRRRLGKRRLRRI